tara:strand:+ start:134 stop:463 length:330 start_codon:yes stop_codon:yes gene_type:complete
MKQKSFKKSKQMYLILGKFISTIINNIYKSNKYKINLIINHIPKYLIELINTLYKNTTINNQENTNNNIKIENITFLKNKFYGKKKTRKKGVLKRKIQKKINNNNNIID